MIIEILILVFLLLCAFEYFTKYDRTGKLVNKIPGPPAWPILGNLPAMLGTPASVWKTLRNWDVKYYPIYKFWTTHQAVVVIMHPDDVETLFKSTKHTHKSSFYNLLFGWLGTGVLTSSGDKWQKRRKMLNHAFNYYNLKQYFECMVEHAENTMDSLKSRGETVYDVNQLTIDYTLRVICEAAMGFKFDDDDLLQKYHDGIRFIGYTVLYRITHPWFVPEFIFRLGPLGQKYKEYLRIMHDFTKKILKERKEYHDKTKGRFLIDVAEDQDVSNRGSPGDYQKKRLAFLDHLIAAQRNKKSIDDQAIQEEVDTFTFVVSHDDTTMALSYAMLLIAENKDVQARIRQEISGVLEKSGGRLGMAEVQNLNYLEMCLKETLRMYTIVPFISREVSEDLQLKNYVVPKGTVIQVHSYAIHHSPEFWPEPEKFDPDRFLPENVSKRHPYSYIPFSAGPRNCIGQKFGMLELKTFMSLLIYNFYLEPVSSTQNLSLIADMILRPVEAIRVKLVPISKDVDQVS